MFSWLRRKLFGATTVREGDGDLPYGSVPDPGLSNHNLFRQWIGIYQLLDKMARARGGVASERPADERMLFIARGLMRYNPYAQGFVSSLRNHVLGANGLTHHAVGPSARAVQEWLDKWKKETDWWQRERELYERVHIEGEAVPRFFTSEGCVELRMIEPEWIVAPDGSEQWTFGFYNELGDVETVTALHALYGSKSEVVDWDEWYHIKSKLSVRADKRGRSDFLSVAPLLDDSFKAWRNFVRSEAVRQAIVYFAEQAPGVTNQDLEQAIAAEGDYAPPSTLGSKTFPGTQLVDSAGVEYLTNGTKLSSVPTAENVQGTMTGVNAALLAVGRPYNMPLVLISGDMSSNNTLDFGDESPFSVAVGDEQRWYSRHVKNVLLRALEYAAEDDWRLARALDDGTDIEVASERKPARDASQNTQRAKTLYDDGVISARERSTMEGVDYDEQQRQKIKEQAGVDPVDNAGVALNGAQISSLLEIVDKVAQKQYPGDAAANIIRTSFPTLPPETIQKIVASVALYKPPQQEQEQQFPGLEEGTQLVTVHRNGKTFQQHRKKGKDRHFTTVPRHTLERAKRIASQVHQRAAELAVRLTPAAQKLGKLLGVVFDTPEDMQKFGYNPTTSSGTANAGHDPVKAALSDAFGVGVSGHIVASVAANVLSRVFTAARKRLKRAAEEADDPYLELARFVEEVYGMVFDALGLEGDRPKAEGIAENLRRLLGKVTAEESAGQGLVEKTITVHRDGKEFKQKRMVRAGSPTVHGVSKLGKKPHSDKEALQKFAEIAPTPEAREAVLDAEWNVPKGDSVMDYTPMERRQKTADRLAAAWRDTLERGDKASADYLEEVMGHFDMETHGPKPGEEVEFNGGLYEHEQGIGFTETVKVLRQPVVLHLPEGRHVAVKGKVAKA